MAEKAQVCAYGLMSIIVLIGYQSTANASSIIVQNGRGLVGIINDVFSTTLIGVSASNTNDNASYVYLQAYANSSNCRALQHNLMDIDGVKGLKFNTAGTLMLVPEVTFIDIRHFGTNLEFDDTITGIFNGHGSNTSENQGEEPECIWTPLQSTPGKVMSHNVTATGRILIYGTGQQTSSQASLEFPLQITILSPSNGEHTKSTLVSAGSYSVVVSDLGCTLTTPTVIDFGPQSANATNGQLLTTKSDGNLTVNCQQNTNPISTTLSLSAGINPIYFSGDDYQVNLINSENNAGAYVTMSLNINGTATNIPFNRTLVDIGTIDASHSSASFSYPITYSLYSRGTGITGKVKGSAELSIVLR
ncbi:MAG: hypothetical protein LBE52_04930 [Providencia sp.]|jgi:hypothetical protein|nr:hypothetical protein [Providencia sp.]